MLSDILDGRMGKGVRERVPGRMVVWKQYKLMTYAGYESYDLLFDLEQDPWELRNIASEQPDLLEKMRAWARLDWDPAQILERDAVHEANMRLISQCVREHKLDHPERWRCPGEKMIVPEHYYKSKKYEAFKKAMMERLKAR